ncbi:hypothetical protein PC129_g5480 [Phytophthora cactorum]|uniref:6-phosphogluconolactonase n=3 Tax=Phytophthora cactorum TaxID=29920 RepID=A0A329SM93_9STRA|nr:hypothetical protein Pcac1_g3596 [Phytophthora cactorum]KAG2814157.1 hypothetical protein PC112_g14439 [Phytophthora cactorum]KAG2827832.1 hypothetical protein PC111_g8422 [Phytophthora cactorum]KAG2858409.1 hypothetical protein PC113_g9833 [Phytophthora cactorum]KAG2908289.1 hypothetical protein PC114_g10523 [Phytophthora cactorum]
MRVPSYLLGLAILAAGVANALVGGTKQSASQPILFVGTHTRDEGWMVGTGKGVYTYKFDTTDGSLTPYGITPVGVNPVFVQGSTKKFSGGKPVLYAVNAVTDESKTNPGTQTGYVSALTMRSNGTLELLNTLESHGGNPTHISLSPNEDVVVVSNYDGSLAMLPLNADGSLGKESFHQDFPTGSKVVMDQQAVGHIHSSSWIPNSNHVVIANLGSDELLQYELDTKQKTLKSMDTVKRPQGSGPRHMAMHPNGEIAYVVDEISNTVGVYEIDKKTALLSSTAVQNITTLPADFTNKSTAADVHLSSDGQFLYASNRGHNSIAMFAVRETDGTLTSLGWESSRGKTPKSFAIYENWMIVANQDSDSMHLFQVNADTGLLTYTGESYDVGTPERVYIGEF